MFWSESIRRVAETMTEIQVNPGHLNFLKATILYSIH